MTAVSGLSSSAHAQGTVKSVHGDWQIRCDTPPGAQGEQCVLIQSVTAEDRPNIGLTVIILSIIPVYLANRLSQDPIGAPTGGAPATAGAAVARG